MVAVKARRKRKRKRKPDKRTVERASRAYRRALSVMREEAMRKRNATDKRLRRSLHDAIDKGFISLAGREKLTAKERDHILKRVSVRGVAWKEAAQDRAIFVRSKAKRGRYAGRYKVVVDSGRLRAGQWVSAQTVRRSLAARAYWNHIQIISDALNIKTREARRILKVLHQAGASLAEMEAVFGEGYAE